MKFNPTDKANSLIADIDFWLFSNGSTLNTAYSLTDRTRNINTVYDEVIAELYKADPNFKWDDTSNTDFPIATIALESGQDHYTMLDSALVIHRVRMKNSEGVLTSLTPVLRSELSDTELNSTGSPSKYYKVGGAIFPVPIPDYSASEGVELEFQRGGNHFTTSSVNEEPGFNPQFHRILSIGAALMYAISNGMTKKAAQLRAEKELVRRAMVEHYQLRSPDMRPSIRLSRQSVRRYGL